MTLIASIITFKKKKKIGKKILPSTLDKKIDSIESYPFSLKTVSTWREGKALVNYVKENVF